MHRAEHEQASADDSVEADRFAAKPGGRAKKIVLSILLVLVLLGGFAAFSLHWLDSALHQPKTFSGQTFQIKRGDSLKRFGAQLKQAGVVNETYPFILYARYKKLAGKLHTGHYLFKDGMNLVQVLDAITTGNYRMSYSFTFVQGSTFKQLRTTLAEAESVQHTLVDKTDKQVLLEFDPAQQFPKAEGLFFPETYAFDPGASDREIMQRAYDAMQETLNELWVTRDKNIEINTPYEALILASIIEKETGLASERKKISGVFMNRLKTGMKLQTDPTVIYGLGDEYEGNITREHLRRDTPYNTYTRHGLPPTPICMPGRAAIEAALHPASTDAVFFVALGDGSGGHKFSKTLTEHNKAVKQYLKALRK